jgi:hypothetical protein
MAPRLHSRITKIGPEPECGHENALFSRQASYVLGQLQIVLPINLLGCYAFALPESVARGALRPLRQPGDPGEGEG